MRKSNHLELTKPLIDFIYGELLGDGSLRKFSRSSQYRHSSKYKEYLEWLKEELYKFNITTTIIRKECENRYHLDTKSYIELTDIYKLWYSNKKKLPHILTLTPITLRQWFIGDGHKNKYLKKYPYIRIFLFPLSFSKEEVQSLSDNLIDLNINNKIRKHNKFKDGYMIIISRRNNVKNFYNYIGECPEDIKNIYGYKWPTEEEWNYIRGV